MSNKGPSITGRLDVLEVACVFILPMFEVVNEQKSARRYGRNDGASNCSLTTSAKSS